MRKVALLGAAFLLGDGRQNVSGFERPKKDAHGCLLLPKIKGYSKSKFVISSGLIIIAACPHEIS